MAELLSKRVKTLSQSQLSANRTEFLGLNQAEPNLGVPEVNGYILSSNTQGERSWINLPQPVFSLLQLSDVNPSGLTEGSTLTYDSQSGKFVLDFTIPDYADGGNF